MTLAIAILNWNGKELLERFLPSVIRYSANAQVAVIDNASEDDSVNFLISHFPSVQIIKNDKNYGFAEGYNRGLQCLEADVFCLLNSDVKVREGWTEPVLKIFKNDETIAVMQPKVLNLENFEYFDYAGAGGGLMDYFGYPYCRGRWHSFIEKDRGQYDDVCPISWASGACLFIRKEVFFQVRGFDKDYFSYQEEVDLCWRIKNSNYQIYYCGASSVYHLGSASFGKNNPKKTFYNFRNSLFSLTKNLSTNKLLFIVFLRILLDGFAGLVFLFQLKPIHTVAILKAHFSYYKNLSSTLKKRKLTQKTNNYHSMISILWYFCILKIKRRKP